jgi:hypothetical protein
MKTQFSSLGKKLGYALVASSAIFVAYWLSKNYKKILSFEKEKSSKRPPRNSVQKIAAAFDKISSDSLNETRTNKNSKNLKRNKKDRTGKLNSPCYQYCQNLSFKNSNNSPSIEENASTSCSNSSAASSSISVIEIESPELIENSINELIDYLNQPSDHENTNRKQEIVDQLLRRSTFVKNHIKPNKLIQVLIDSYSSLNKNLFEKYCFNNTLGEIDTEILLGLLNIINSVTDFSISVPIDADLDFLLREHSFIDLLFSYINELYLNKNNIKRQLKCEHIRVYSLLILGNIFEIAIKANESNFNGNAANLAEYILKKPTMGWIGISTSPRMDSKFQYKRTHSYLRYLDLLLKLCLKCLQHVPSFMLMIRNMMNESDDARQNSLPAPAAKTSTLHEYIFSRDIYTHLKDCESSEADDEQARNYAASIIKTLGELRNSLMSIDGVSESIS